MRNSKLAKFALIAFILLSAGLLYLLAQYAGNTTKIEGTEENNLDNWKIDSSELNGLPLNEDKSIYGDDTDTTPTNVYITVFPTETEAGQIYNFKDFGLVNNDNLDFNPVLNANIQFGDENGNLSNIKNPNQINSTIAVRGASSRNRSYKSYKIELKEGAGTFKGQTMLNINKHMSDISKIANKFCMDMMSGIDNMASFQTDFMIVYIKDGSLREDKQVYEYYGLYTNIEQPNKTYLKQRGLDSNGNLYKVKNFEFRQTAELKNVDDPDYDEEAFETVLGIREAQDHTKLLQMLTDINDMNQDFEPVFNKYFNEENYLTWLACNVLLGNEDTVSHNFILYNPQNSLTWYMLPWDYDGTFAFGEYTSTYSTPVPLKGIQRLTGVLLHRRYLKQPGNIEKLTAKIDELLQTNFTEEKVNTLLNSYRPVLEATMDKSPDLLITRLAPNEFNAYLDQFYGQILQNYQNYKESLKYTTPVFVSEPEKNLDGSTDFRWEASHSFDGSFINYNITLAKDTKMQDIVFEEKNLSETFYTYKQDLPAGTYFLKITSVNDDGLEQYSLDFYHSLDTSERIFGIREVVIQ